MTFEDCKSSLNCATLLALPDPSAKMALYTDASVTVIGAALQQRITDSCQPIAFYTHKLFSPLNKIPDRTTASSLRCIIP